MNEVKSKINKLRREICEILVNHLKSQVGEMAESEAVYLLQESGVHWRDASGMITSDFQPFRVNVAFKDGKLSSVSVG